MTPPMWRLGGHLGSTVSALVDGQLDPATTERAWAHVMTCPPCRRLVEREGWVKRQLVEMAGADAAAPPPDLVGALYELDPATREAWSVVEHLEDRARTRRRAGIAAVGVGGLSAAVFGLTTLSGAQLGIGEAPGGPPATSLIRPTSTADAVSGTDGAASPSVDPFSGWVGRGPRADDSGGVPVRTSR